MCRLPVRPPLGYHHLTIRQGEREAGLSLIVAPERQRSAASHAITLHKPLRLTEMGPRRFALSGTPVDCVYVGIQRLCDRPPAVVARAEARLNSDDIAGALNELSALTGAAADVAQGWIATARARVNADEVMGSLDDSLRISSGTTSSDSNPVSDKNSPDDNSPPAGEP